MRFALDLWDYGEVIDMAERVLERVEDGTMPCDEPWDDGQIALLRQWINEGMDP